jgi:hypothetical protein
MHARFDGSPLAAAPRAFCIRFSREIDSAPVFDVPAPARCSSSKLAMGRKVIIVGWRRRPPASQLVPIWCSLTVARRANANAALTTLRRRRHRRHQNWQMNFNQADSTCSLPVLVFNYQHGERESEGPDCFASASGPVRNLLRPADDDGERAGSRRLDQITRKSKYCWRRKIGARERARERAPFRARYRSKRAARR